MQTALSTFALVSALILIVAAVVTVFAFRNAPEGHEDEQGFQLGQQEPAPAMGQVLLFNAAGAAVPVTAHAAWAGQSQGESDRSIAA
jgi:hypothetical protein